MERWPLDPLDPYQVHRCRARFKAWLHDELKSGNPFYEYELVFGELITNAVRYGRGPVHVEIRTDDKRLVISVEDFGACFNLSAKREPTADDENGRGLDIVRQLTTQFRVTDGENNPCRVEAQLKILV